MVHLILREANFPISDAIQEPTRGQHAVSKVVTGRSQSPESFIVTTTLFMRIKLQRRFRCRHVSFVATKVGDEIIS